MEFREDSPRYRAANGAKGRPKEYKPQNYMENSFKKSDNEQPAEQKHNGDNNSFEFDYDQSDFNINRVSNNFDDGKFGSFFHSKIGVEQSQELSKINRMYDVFYTEKQTLFYIEDFINQNESKYPREREKINESQNTERTSQLFGLEEEVKLNENETIRIVNTKVAYSGPSKHHEYKIIGRYMGEEFIIFRRFREFYLLNKVLHERWPGFYIPPVPKKKAYGNMNYKIITNRIFILNRFLFELSERKYLWESEEIRIFIKPENNLICELKALKSLSIEEVLERIRPHVEINLDINDNHIDDSFNNIKFFKEQVISNLEFLNKFKIFLRKQAEFVDDYLRSNAYLMDGLYVFENSSLEIYSRQTCDNTTKSLKIISDTDNEKIGNEFCTIPFRIKNPFLMMSLWISCEILDLESIITAISQIDKICKERAKLVQKIDTDNSEIQRLTEGRATLKSMFKSRQGRNDLASNLKTAVNRNRVIMETYRNVINGLIIFMEMKEIPNFKLMKTSHYYKTLTNFCLDEFNGHNEIINLWNRLINVLNTKESQWNSIMRKVAEAESLQNKVQHLNLDNSIEEVYEKPNYIISSEESKHLQNLEDESKAQEYQLLVSVDYKEKYDSIMKDYFPDHENKAESENNKNVNIKEIEAVKCESDDEESENLEKIKKRNKRKQIEFEYA